MELQLTGKHAEIQAEERALAEKLAERLAADYEKLNSLRIVLSVDHGKACAEANLTGKHVTLNASCNADSTAASLTGCVDKLDRQMRRYLERIQDRSVTADPKLKEKIWQSADLKKPGDEEDEELFG